jgi:hypothetical protein
VDEVTDTAEVLQAVLEPRGLTVNRVSRLDQTNLPPVAMRPAVVVLNAESCDRANCPGWAELQAVPQVVIGTVRISGAISPSSAERRYLQKPFHFADLVQAVEALIAGPTGGERAQRVNK